MPAAGLPTHGAGGEADPIGVTALLLEPREADALASPLARARGLPVPVGVHRPGDAVGIRLLGTLTPPRLAGFGVDAHVAFDLVPAFAQPPQRWLRRLNPAGRPLLDIIF